MWKAACLCCYHVATKGLANASRAIVDIMDFADAVFVYLLVGIALSIMDLDDAVCVSVLVITALVLFIASYRPRAADNDRSVLLQGGWNAVVASI